LPNSPHAGARQRPCSGSTETRAERSWLSCSPEKPKPRFGASGPRPRRRPRTPSGVGGAGAAFPRPPAHKRAESCPGRCPRARGHGAVRPSHPDCIRPVAYRGGARPGRGSREARDASRTTGPSHRIAIRGYCGRIVGWLGRVSDGEVRARTMLVQREMESGRSPLVSIPPRLARVSGLIWPKGCFFERTEFRLRKGD
jgi:hypothetical protein